MDKLSNIRLVDSSMNLIGYASNVTATTATFANLNSSTNASNTIAVDQTATYYIIADVNSPTDAT